MKGLYNHQMVRLMAQEIVNQIGVDRLYTNINTHHPGAPKNYMINKVDLIGDFVLKMYKDLGQPISLMVMTDEKLGENIFGLFVQRGNQNYILINENLNNCWNRFTKLKEFCSLYVDHYDKESRLTKYDNYLDSLRNAFEQKSKLLGKTNLDDGDLDSETFSILLAIELMIPLHKREITNALFAKFEESKITMNDIAKSLMMPEFVLKLYHEKKLHLRASISAN
jgi:hypothetical protein